MNLSSALIAAFATLFAAGIAASVSLVVSVLSKEQKTSEFRQQWIDGLRADVSEWIGEVVMLYQLSQHLKGDGNVGNREAINQRFENLVNLRMLATRIELRLNPDEHQAMLKAIQVLRDTDPAAEKSVLNPRIDMVAKECKAILKAEWERVKMGEPALVRTKLYATRLIKAALIATAVLLVIALATQTGVLSTVRSVSTPRPTSTIGEPSPGAIGGNTVSTGKLGSTPTGSGGR